jgi:hypothetical protein
MSKVERSLPGLELRPLGRPARSQSLYRLSYPGSWRNIRGEETSSQSTTPRESENSLVTVSQEQNIPRSMLLSSVLRQRETNSRNNDERKTAWKSSKTFQFEHTLYAT